jgi:predicted Zn-dependent protease
LLNHFARGEAYEREAKFIADASSVAMMGVLVAGSRVEKRGNQISVGVKDGKDTAEDMLKAMMVGFAIETISAMFNSDWAREQEDEADLLGVDLMAKAGYDVEAATRVLDRLRQTRESAKVDLDKFADMYGTVLAKAAAQGGLDGLKKGLLVVVADAAIRGAKDLLADITKSHADPKRRWEDVGNYIAREYQDPFDETVAQANRKSYAALVADKNVAAVLDNHDAATLALRALQSENPDISSATAKSRQAIGKPTDRAPYALRSYGKVQMSTGNGGEAVRALAIAAADPGASFQTVTLYASALGQMGKFPEAHAALDRASSKFGSAEAVYPARIEMYRLQGDTEKMTATANECFKVENKEIRSSCQASQGQDKGQKKSACTGNESGFEKLFCGVTDL